MHEAVGSQAFAVLANHEPGIDVRLAMQPLGQIHGTYAFESEHAHGEPTILSGAFEIDQSCLRRLLASVDSLVWLLGGVSIEYFHRPDR
jgi:hypothetical protein